MPADSETASVKGELESHHYGESARVASLLALGKRKRSFGDFEGAVQAFDMALGNLKSSSQGGMRLRLALHTSKGVALSSQGCSELASEEYGKAFRLCRVLGFAGKVSEAVLLLNKGVLSLQHKRDLDAAAAEFTKALEIRGKSNSLSTPGGALLLERIADLKLERGDHTAAFDAYTSALQHLQAGGSMERLEGARLLTKLGTIDRTQRHYKPALQKYTHAASILIRSKATGMVAFARLQADIGFVWRELGELGAAKKTFEKALAVRIQTNSLRTFGGILLLMNYGTTLRKLEDQQGMLKQYSQARQLQKELGVTASAADVHMLLQISAAANELGEKEWAVEACLEAQRVRKMLDLPQTPEGERVLRAIGGALLLPFSEAIGSDVAPPGLFVSI